ncbi:CrcB family protein [Oceanobacillus caeni]|nr:MULTISPECIES: CrcB family protein [Bacillaceae]MED4473582.1 CrcB family protein [Oceanobacillus caeni]
MQHVLLGIAGSIGAILRYMISILFSTNQLLVFPFATVTVNLLGCFILGLLSSGLELMIKVEPKYLTAFKTG